MILPLQLQSILERMQDSFTTDRIMRMENISLAIVHTHFRPYSH